MILTTNVSEIGIIYLGTIIIIIIIVIYDSNE